MPLKPSGGIRGSGGIRHVNLAGLPQGGPGVRMQHLPGGRVIVSADAARGGGLPSRKPWQLTGAIVSGDARITVHPALVNNAVPTIDMGTDTSLAAIPAPYLTVTGTDGIIVLRVTHDAAGTITHAGLASLTSVPADTTTGTLYKYKTVGTWTSGGGIFTSVTSILNTNQTFRLCAGAAEWY